MQEIRAYVPCSEIAALIEEEHSGDENTIVLTTLLGGALGLITDRKRGTSYAEVFFKILRSLRQLRPEVEDVAELFNDVVFILIAHHGCKCSAVNSCIDVSHLEFSQTKHVFDLLLHQASDEIRSFRPDTNPRFEYVVLEPQPV